MNHTLVPRVAGPAILLTRRVRAFYIFSIINPCRASNLLRCCAGVFCFGYYLARNVNARNSACFTWQLLSRLLETNFDFI